MNPDIADEMDYRSFNLSLCQFKSMQDFKLYAIKNRKG